MAIREIHGSIGKEMINGKFYSMSKERHEQIFGKKIKKTKETTMYNKKPKPKPKPKPSY